MIIFFIVASASFWICEQKCWKHMDILVIAEQYHTASRLARRLEVQKIWGDTVQTK